MAKVFLDTRPSPGDTDNVLLAKILQKLSTGGPISIGDVTLAVSDIEIGAVELKDATSDTRAVIKTSDPAGGDAGIVVRNIPSGTQAVSGTFFQATQPVSIAAVVHVDDNAGSLTVDGTVAVSNFPATQPVSGSVSISNFPATQSVTQGTSPWVVSGTVTITPSGTQDENIKQVNGATVNVGSGAIGTGTQRVVLATDQPVIPVSDNGGSLTVDGSVSISNFPATQPVSNAGIFAVQESGAALTSLQLIDDVVTTDDAARNKSAVIGAVFDDVATTAITENQAGYLRMSSRRALLVEGVSGGTAIPVSGTFFQATQPVSIAANVTVVGTGTLVVQATLAAETTKVIGTVNQGTNPWVVSGTITSTPSGTQDENIKQVNGATVNVGVGAAGTGTQRVAVASDSSIILAAGTAEIGNVKNSGTFAVQIAANSSVNVAQINGITPLMGNGVTGTGSQRVTIASDNTAFSVNATLSAETTKAIGVVRNADGSGNLLTSNSTTYTAKFGLDSNLLGTLGTAFTTPGFVDIKGADGNVFVRQTTAANLNATVVGTGTFAVQDSQVIVDNAGFTDGTSKVFTAGFIFDEVAGTALTENDAAAARVDSKRAQVVVLEDATTRGQRLAISSAGAMSITGVAATIPSSTAMFTAAAANANSTTLNVQGYATAVLKIDAAVFTGTFSIQVSENDTDWINLKGHLIDGSLQNTQVSDISIAGSSSTVVRVSVSGFKSLRGVISGYSAGNLTVVGYVSSLTADSGIVQLDQTTPGTTNAVSLAQIRSTTIATGNGVVGTGVQRVSIASDNTAFSVNATLSAETTKVIGTVNQGTNPWIVAGGGTAGTAASGVVTIQGIASMTAVKVDGSAVTQPVSIAGTVSVSLAAETTKVIGVVRNADGAGNLLTSNSTTYTAKFGLDSNLLGTLGTAFTTPGFVDIKGADGNVFVRQTTAANLNATVVGTGTFAVQIAANSSVNVAQINGVTALMGSGILGTGSLRVTIASDNDALTIKQATGTNLHAVIDSGTVTTVSTVTNLSQLGGAAVSMNTGVRDAGTQRVTIATNDSVPVTMADGANVTLGAKTDASSTATDATSVTIMQVLKQISVSTQAVAASLPGNNPLMVQVFS